MSTWLILALLSAAYSQHCRQRLGQISEGCKSCNSKYFRCTECSEGYLISQESKCCPTFHQLFPSPRTGVCEPCHEVIAGCMICGYTTQVICEKCHPDYTLWNGGCCPNDYTFPDVTTRNCYGSPQGCVSCQFYLFDGFSQACYVCASGYHLSNGVCCKQDEFGVLSFSASSINTCSSCSVLEGCLKCYGYYGPPKCQLCSDGYVLSGGICCSIQDQQYPHFYGKCLPCQSMIFACESCIYDGEVKCVACNERGYYLVGSVCCDIFSQCHSCPKGCSLCEENPPGAITCNACHQYYGFQLANGECCDVYEGEFPSSDGCVPCQHLYPHCSSCYYSKQAQHTYCQFCGEDYILCDHQCLPQCNTCSEECLVCQNGECQQCRTPYLLSIDGTCCNQTDSIITFNRSCILCSNLVEGCLSCQLTSQPSGEETYFCDQCDQAHQYYASFDGSCCNVKEGMYPSTSGGCQRCSEIIQSCAKCEIMHGVTKCRSKIACRALSLPDRPVFGGQKHDYRLCNCPGKAQWMFYCDCDGQIKFNQCSGCRILRMSCICTQSEPVEPEPPEYDLNCVDCPEGCLQCTVQPEQLQCTKCEQGYQLDAGRCLKKCVVNHCDSCQDPHFCTSCAEPFKPQSQNKEVKRCNLN